MFARYSTKVGPVRRTGPRLALTARSASSACARSKFRAAIGTYRPGITLLEILVSIFILVIGLLGTAALIPIGNSEVLKGGIAHRGAEVGIRGYHEFRVRRMN